MNRMNARIVIALVALVALAHLSALAANSPVGKVMSRTGTSLINGTVVGPDTTVFSGDVISTQGRSLALVELGLGDAVHFGSTSSATLTRMGSEVLVSLNSGMVKVYSGSGQAVVVNARGLVVRPPAGTADYEVAIGNDAIAVASTQGDLEVLATNRSFAVPSGRMMKFEVAPDTAAQANISPGGRNISPGVAAIVAVAISVGVSLPVSYVFADDAEDDAIEEARRLAQQACEDAIRSITPTGSTAGCAN